MARFSLFEIRPLSSSLGVYVPAVVVQRALNLARLLFFAWLMQVEQFGLLGLATLVFALAGTLVTFGSFGGISRYISYYEAKGELAEFFRTISRQVTLLAALVTAVLLIFSRPLASWLMGTSAQTAIGPQERWAIFAAALVNGFLSALYLNMGAWMRGLRLYRLLSVAEVVYAVLFFGLGIAVLKVRPTALMALTAHAISLGLVLAAGTWAIGYALIKRAMERVAQPPSAVQGEGFLPLSLLRERGRGEGSSDVAQPPSAVQGEGSADVAQPPSAVQDKTTRFSMLRAVLKFSIPAMLAGLAMMLLGSISLWFVQRFSGEKETGLFQAYFQLCQPIPVLATTIWGVLFTYAAVHWERQEKDLARRQLEVVYKLSVLGLAVLAVAINATSNLWITILPQPYRAAINVLPWLLIYVLAVANMGYAYVISQLRERPAVMIYITLAAVAVNAALAWILVPRYGATGGAMAAAVGAAIGLLAATLYVFKSDFPASAARSSWPFPRRFSSCPAGDRC